MSLTHIKRTEPRFLMSRPTLRKAFSTCVVHVNTRILLLSSAVMANFRLRYFNESLAKFLVRDGDLYKSGHSDLGSQQNHCKHFEPFLLVLSDEQEGNDKFHSLS